MHNLAIATANLFPPNALPLTTARRGSGVLIRAHLPEQRDRFAIATAAHVAEFAGTKNKLEVRFGDGTTALTEVCTAHVEHDAAVLRFLDWEPSDELADAAFEVNPTLVVAPDEEMVAAGIPMAWSPGALQPSLESRGGGLLAPWQRVKYGTGEVTATFQFDDRDEVDESVATHVLHTARTENGASGGPLVRLRDGALVGVNSVGDREDHLAVSVSVIAALLAGVDFDGDPRWQPEGIGTVNRRAEQRGDAVLALVYGDD